MIVRWFVVSVAFFCVTEGKFLQDSSLGLNEIAYHNEPSLIFIGAPSIVRLSTGRLLVSHEYFTLPGYTPVPNVTLYASDDNGQTWSFVSNVSNTFFATLFIYKDTVYIIGMANELNKAMVIHRSNDNGATWNYNGSDQGVVLFNDQFAGGVTPVVIANDMLYRTTEYWPPPYTYPQSYKAAMMTCNLSRANVINDDDDPLMDPKHWKITPPLPFNESWIPKSFPNISAPGFLEGNAVVVQNPGSNEYRILNIIRFNSIPLSNLAIILELNQTTNTLSFVSIIDFPGGMTKFVIRYDPVTQAYYSLVNPVTSPSHPTQRNILSLSYTKDLVNLSDWKILIDRLLYDDTGLSEEDSYRYTGFHYVDWQFDHLTASKHNASCIVWNCDGGSDIVYAIRTAYRGANTFHNTNRITYKNLTDYRQLFWDHEKNNYINSEDN